MAARSPMPGRSGCVHVCAVAVGMLLMLLPGAGTAKHLVVDPSGNGDFTLIQAGIDSIAGWPPPPPVDTLIVLPGAYAETLYFAEPGLLGMYLYCVGGPSQTRVEAVRGSASSFSGPSWRVVGLTVTNVAEDIGRADWTHCRFEGGCNALVPARTPNLHSCELHGPVSLIGFRNGGPDWPRQLGFDDLTFINASLVTRNELHRLTFDRCRFIGSQGWAARFDYQGDGYFEGGFRDCTFENCENGVQFTWAGWSKDYLLERCRFVDISGVGVEHRDPDGGGPHTNQNTHIHVRDSRFERCGKPVHLDTGCRLTMLRDTLTDAGSTAIEGRVRTATLDGVVIEAAAGDGIQLHRVAYGDAWWLPALSISHCELTKIRGDCITISDVVEAPQSDPVTVSDCRVAVSNGVGVRLDVARAEATRNVITDNGSHGIALWLSSTGETNTGPWAVASNTCVGNMGDGVRIEDGTADGSGPCDLQRNLLAFNLGAGLRVLGAPGSPAKLALYDDAWENAGGSYVGVLAPADSNLTVDPSFCDIAVRRLTLQADSPCAATGPFGLIGALPADCPATTGMDRSGPLVVFAPHPNPARGRVEFTLPSGSAAGCVELYDLQGRVRWRIAVAAGQSSVRFDGSTPSGPLSPGLYWARLTAPGVDQRRRMVWLK